MTNRIASLIVGLLLILTAIVSGAVYPWSKDAFTFVVTAAFLLAMIGRDRPDLKAAWPVWTLVGVTYLSALWTVNLNGTLSQAFTLTGYALFVCLAGYSTDGEKRAGLLKAAFAAAVLVSLYGIYQYFIGFAHTEEYLREAGTASGLSAEELARAMSHFAYGRAFSTMFSPNVLACYLAMVFPVGLYLLNNSDGIGKKAMYALGLAIMFAACLLTKSVGGGAAFGCGVVVYIIFLVATGRMRISRRVVAAVLIAVLVAGAAGWFVLKERSGGFYGFGRSVSERTSYFAGALGVIAERPLAGFGAGSFPAVYPAHAPSGDSETRFAHNLLLQTLAETGIPGLTALLLVFGVCLKRCVKERDDALTPAIAAGAAAFFVHNLLDVSYYIPETAVMFWFLFSLTGTDRQEVPKCKRWELSLRASVVVSVIIFGFFYTKAYLAGQKMSEAMDLLRESGITSQGLARSRPASGEAVRLAEEAVALKPYDDSLHAFLAGIYEGEASAGGREYHVRALAEYKAAIRLNPYYPFYYKDLGLLYLNVGDRKSAREQFLEAIKRYPAGEGLKKYLPLTEK